jgi:ferritin-like metal-binding protein YciE
MMSKLDDLFLDTLQDALYVERTLVKRLPKLAAEASSTELKDTILGHLRETEIHVERLETIFDMMGKPASAKKCEALEGLLKETVSVTGDIDDEQTRDAAIIALSQAIEHYEIARYGTLACWAEELGGREIQLLLEETLEEEKQADQKLSALAESSINERAAA